MIEQGTSSEFSYLGEAQGRLVSKSPGGRYIALQNGSKLSILNPFEGLREILSTSIPGKRAKYAIHPSGTAIAAITDDGSLRRITAEEGSWSITGGPTIDGSNWYTQSTITYSASGATLFHLTEEDGKGLIRVLRSPSLSLICTAHTEIPWPPDDAFMRPVGAGAADTIVVATNSGDSITGCLIVDVVGDEATIQQMFLYDLIDGERLMDICSTPPDKIIVLDSDGILSIIDYKQARRQNEIRAWHLLDERGMRSPLLLGPVAITRTSISLVVYQYKEIGGYLREYSQGVASFAPDGTLVQWHPWPANFPLDSVELTSSGILCIAHGTKTKFWKLL